MPINLHWYSRNEANAYPFDDTASGIDDSNQPILNGLLIDAAIRWPHFLGDRAFVSGLSITDNIVVVLFQISNGTNSFIPLGAAVSSRPVTPGTMVPIQPQMPGVGGWVVFGSLVTQGNYRSVFSQPEQSLLALRAARPYRQAGVREIRVLGSSARLRGEVTIEAEKPLITASGTRIINGETQDVGVILLEQESDENAIKLENPEKKFRTNSIFRAFAGPCGARPESRTCEGAQPIEYIAGVGPDCDGLIKIVVEGCGNITKIDGIPAIRIDCDLDLEEACPKDYLADSIGNLPSQYKPAEIPPYTPPDTPFNSDSFPVVSDNSNLPAVNCFEYGLTGWVIVSGNWDSTYLNNEQWACEYLPSGYPISLSNSEFPPDNYWPAVNSTSAAMTAIALWPIDTYGPIGREGSTIVVIRNNPKNSQKIAGLIVNHEPHPLVSGLWQYYTAYIDINRQEFRVSRWNGTGLQTIASATISSPGLRLNTAYRILFRALPGPGTTRIFAALFDITDNVLATIGPTSIAAINSGGGDWGIYTQKTIAAFTNFFVREFSGDISQL